MHRIQYKNISEQIPLTLDAMKAHWALKEHGVEGDSILSFSGPFRVTAEDFLDITADTERNLIAQETPMLHFIAEHFDDSLELAIYRQYLLVSIAEEKLDKRLGKGHIIRWGEVLYDGRERLSTSAVTKNPVSTKIHLGLFLEDQKDKQLKGIVSLGIEPMEFAQLVVGQYRAEYKRLADKRWTIRAL